MADKIVQLVDKNNDNIYPVASVPNAAKITMTDVDPGEGSPLAADNYIAVYGSAPLEFDYSLNEVDTGTKWIDGKAIYKKTIDFGSLPNNDTKTVAHNIADLEQFLDIKAICYHQNKTAMTLPYIAKAGAEYYMVCAVNVTNVIVETSVDRTAFKAYITLYYTKTS